MLAILETCGREETITTLTLALLLYSFGLDVVTSSVEPNSQAFQLVAEIIPVFALKNKPHKQLSS